MPGVRQLLTDATRRLSAAGVSSPRVDAELLLAHTLGISRARLYGMDDVPPDLVPVFEDAVRRRATREPLQHIVGNTAFRHVEVAVGVGVFVPRPETELLVDAVLPHLRMTGRACVVDLCSGSGALAVAIADEVPGAHVVAVELAPAALRWLEQNVAGTGVRVVAGDVRDPDLLSDLRGHVDAVVANPPYVPSAAEVEPEVRADPSEAVFSGTDGLELMPHLFSRAAELLRPGGVLAAEHDDTHAAAAPGLLGTEEWTDIVEHADLAGRPRYVTARRL